MYFIGIDGGGTKTLACILNGNGEVVSSGLSGPSSIDTVGIDVTISNIDEAICCAFNKVNLKVEGIESIFAGLGGIACSEDERLVENAIKSLPYAAKATVNARNDVSNALAGGLATRCGMAIILGTGSVCFGENECGMTHRAGGIHFKEGDAGSAYDLGRQSLKSLARAMDKRIEMTAFHHEVAKQLQVATFKDLVNVFDELFMNRTKTASLAKLVTQFANDGDPSAISIVEKSTDEAALLVKAVLEQINFSTEEKVLATIGSLVNVESMYRELFIKKIKHYDASVKVIRPLLDPAIGSALMAYKLAGHHVCDEMIESNKNLVL